MHLLPLDGFLDVVGGLPVHPLLVHFAVVVLPVAALAQIVVAFVPRLRRQWATPVLLATAAGTAFAFLAKESGEQLAAHIGLPASHALWGDILPPVAVALLVVTAAWWYLQRKAKTASTVPLLLTQLLSAVLAAGVAALTVLVGHTGAQAAWGGRIVDTTQPAAATSPSATASSSTSTTDAAAGAFTMAKVAQHNTAASCWTAINGNVYDLTAWINVHPGGPGVIKGLCGVDGTSAFSAQHGGDQRVASRLSTFKLGTLSG